MKSIKIKELGIEVEREEHDKGLTYKEAKKLETKEDCARGGRDETN